MALGDCTNLPYRLTPAEVSQISAAQSGNVDFVQFLNGSTPPWGVVVPGGCGQILVTKDTSGNLLMADITGLTWNGSNVAATLSGAQYAPGSTGTYPYESTILYNLPAATQDVLTNWYESFWSGMGAVASWPGAALSSIGTNLSSLYSTLTAPFNAIDPTGTLGNVVVIGGGILLVYAVLKSID